MEIKTKKKKKAFSTSHVYESSTYLTAPNYK